MAVFTDITINGRMHPYKFFNNRYLRLKEVQIGYTFPTTLTKKLVLKIESLRNGDEST